MGVTFSPEDVASLRSMIGQRRIALGTAWLDQHRHLIETLDPAAPGAASFVGYLAQWVDAGYGSPSLLENLIARFPAGQRDWLTLAEYAHLRMAEAVVAMFAEEPDRAIERLQLVLALGDELHERGLLVIANFWIARSLRKKGRYDDALTYAVAARTAAQELGFTKMVAIVQVLEVWLYFQKGKTVEAHALLKKASDALADCDDHISRGNIESAFGRIARRSGRYRQALMHFAAAVEEYKLADPRHPHLARTLVNSAFVKRLMSLQIHKKLDEESARRGKPAGESKNSAALENRAHVDRLRQEARQDLTSAAEIYAEHHIHAGLGNTHVNLGHLYLDRGDLDLAAEEAQTALEMGEQKFDYILIARSRILQSMVEHEKYEEEVDDGYGPEHHAQLAHDLACDAVESAERTQNRRLIARAYVWQGLTLCNELLFDANGRDRARECHDKAAELLRPEPQDYIWNDLQTLKRKSFRTDSVNATLLEWSQGVVGEKSFQQIAEEFAEMIIPKVWEREGRKVSRVAKRLAVSPKKVRRVLSSRGLLDRAD